MNKRIQVFREELGFLKLFKLFKEKYRSLGRIGGSVSTKPFTPEELASIAGFLGVSPETLVRKGTISLGDFERELAHTGFEDLSLLELMEESLQESIKTKKEELEIERREEMHFIDSLMSLFPEGSTWFEWIGTKPSETRWIWTLFRQDQEGLREKLVTVATAFFKLPKKGEYERLPFFAQRMTGNPHYFDRDEVAGKLLVNRLFFEQMQGGNEQATMPKSVEELNDLLAEYGLMRDDLWNFVTVQGLLASSDGVEHPVWTAAVRSHSVMNMPIKELVKVDKIWPATGAHVWIVENSSVCSMIMDAISEAPIICTHGQVRAAGWLFLDRLAESGCTFHYSGDIDPEGIVIAARLKNRYGTRLRLWRMDQESYEQSLSNEKISPNRMAKVERLSTSDEWKELIGLMQGTKKAGYQEGIIVSLIEDIKSRLNL